MANFDTAIRSEAYLHYSMKGHFEGFPENAPPMAILSSMVSALSAYYPDSLEPDPHNQQHIARLLSKLRTIAAFSYQKKQGRPVQYPRNELDYCGNFLHMMYSHPAEPLYEPDPELVRALNVLLILHADHEQIHSCLGLAPEAVRCHPTGIGGAFGAREDMNMHIHACLLALRTGRPVKMVYDRAESFVGHVHRHPARMWYRHEADSDGQLIRVEAKLILDGGAYGSTTAAVTANATYFAVGPYRVDTAIVDGYGVRTNNPPCGAMRGFGAVQSCFAYESQMDRLAAELDERDLADRDENPAALLGGQGERRGRIFQHRWPPLRRDSAGDGRAAIGLYPPGYGPDHALCIRLGTHT